VLSDDSGESLSDIAASRDRIAANVADSAPTFLLTMAAEIGNALDGCTDRKTSNPGWG